MKLLISALLSLLPLTARAVNPSAPEKLQIYCAIVRWDLSEPIKPNPAKYLLSKNIDYVQDDNAPYGMEVFREGDRSYLLDVSQHDAQFKTHQSILILTILNAKTNRVLGESSVMWPEQPHDSKLVGITRAQVEIPDSDAMFSVQFFCDQHLKAASAVTP